MDNWKMNLWNLVVGKTYYRNQARFERKYWTTGDVSQSRLIKQCYENNFMKDMNQFLYQETIDNFTFNYENLAMDY